VGWGSGESCILRSPVANISRNDRLPGLTSPCRVERDGPVSVGLGESSIWQRMIVVTGPVGVATTWQ
jgi:hypothetical protein